MPKSQAGHWPVFVAGGLIMFFRSDGPAKLSPDFFPVDEDKMWRPLLLTFAIAFFLAVSCANAAVQWIPGDKCEPPPPLPTGVLRCAAAPLPRRI